MIINHETQNVQHKKDHGEKISELALYSPAVFFLDLVRQGRRHLVLTMLGGTSTFQCSEIEK